MVDYKKEAIDFLIYSFFGIDIFGKTENGEESVKNACAKRAYLDLARTIDYRISTSKLNEMKKKSSSSEDKEAASQYENKKHKALEAVCTKIIDSIKKYPGENKKFDNWHKDMCDIIIETVLRNEEGAQRNVVNGFTYGQAQKWLNMTLKYYWLLGLLPDSINEKDLHVPIDSYIIEAVQSPKDKIEYGLNMKAGLKSDSWSKMSDYDGEYKKLQSSIRNRINELFDICPIKWENKAWIEVAKYRANQ